MAFDDDVPIDRGSHRGAWQAWTVAAVAVAAAATIACGPAAAEPSSGSAPDVPVEVPIPGGFQGFSEILRFVPSAPPVPQMPLGRPVPHRGGAIPPASGK
ncbi:hypothetical protein ABZ894_00430 [Nocardia beijingensis]|uniref:hypothetical protein n=1 Tax=Nocardia beijingensis TaxID=95162 RepID=UPI0033C573AC